MVLKGKKYLVRRKTRRGITL